MDHLVRAAGLEGFSELVLELGYIPESLLKKAQIDAKVLRNSDVWIPYRDFLRLLQLAAEETGCEYFGLNLSRKQDLRMFGAIGSIMRESDDVRSALADLIEYFHLYNQGANIELTDDGKLAFLQFSINEPGNIDSRQQEGLAAGVGLNIMRTLCGHQWAPVRVFFTHSAPRNKRPLQKMFRAPIHFDEEFLGVLFDANTLDIKLSHADKQLHQALKAQLSFQNQQTPVEPGDNIKRLITKAMLSGDCSIDQVASYLAINKRTLQRQLRSQQLSFKRLLEEVRFDTATKYLMKSSISLTRISDILCYTDISAFSRAFKLQYEVSPSQWRKTSRLE